MPSFSFSATRALAPSPVFLVALCFTLQVRQGSDVVHNRLLLHEDIDSSVHMPSTERELISQPDQTGLEEGTPLAEQLKKRDGPKIAFAASTASSPDTIKLWMKYHQTIGVSSFYLFTDGRANNPEAKRDLEKLASVKVFPNDDKMKDRRAQSRAWNESWLGIYFNKPCNNELFVMQSLNMEVAIEQARVDGVDWLFQVDTDELIYPAGSPEYSLKQYLSTMNTSIDTVVFPNHEAVAERDDVKDPFLEVTLFKRNFMQVRQELFFAHYHEVARGNPNYFLAYGNGKSGVRVQPEIRSDGAHRWSHYNRTLTEHTSSQSSVLHYVYNRFEDLKGRRDRCDCLPTEEDVKRCFILEFDREAFIASSLMGDQELLQYFRDRLVFNDTESVSNLLKAGLFGRIHTPQTMMRLYRQMPDMGMELAEPGESKMTVVDSYQPH